MTLGFLALYMFMVENLDNREEQNRVKRVLLSRINNPYICASGFLISISVYTILKLQWKHAL